MMNKIIKVFQYSLLSFLFLGCDPEPRFPAGDTSGYKPIYASTKPITFGSARIIRKPGKICRYKDYLLISENNSGIHVFNNIDPEHPVDIGFIEIADNVGMEVSDNLLIADYQNHLVSLDLSDLPNIKETSRARAWVVSVPPITLNYYECPDASREVIGWQQQVLSNPKCYR